MSVTITVGGATLIALSDNEQSYQATSVYPQASTEQLDRYRDLLSPDGTVLLNFGCYLVRVDGQTVLVDTGWGPGRDGKLLEELTHAGVAAGSVDAVVFTHLHGDHIGWNMEGEGDAARPRFSKARYLAPEADWRHYNDVAEPSPLFRAQMQPLERLGVLDLVSGERTLSPSLTIVPTPGHTPGHMSLAVVSGGEHALVLGDVLISEVDLAEPSWVISFDWNAEIAERTRRETVARVERDRALVAASHLPKPGLGRIVTRDGRPVWQPLA